MLRLAQHLLVRILPARVVYALAERRHAVQEPELLHVEELVDPARAAVDVGAWLGPWTRALSRRVVAVHAFEPQPRLAARLRRVAAANVAVHQQAVGREPGTVQLVVDERPGRDALARVRSAGGPVPEGRTIDVELVRLDDVDLGDVGFLKIDVEGFEAEVIDGAVGLLGRCRPVVLLEIEQRHLDTPIADTFARLLDQGYEGSFLRRGAWQPLGDFDVDRDQLRWVDRLPCAEYVHNFRFQPVTDVG